MWKFMSSVLSMLYPQAATIARQEKKPFNPNEGTNRYGISFNNDGESVNKPQSSRQTLAYYEFGEEGHFARACPKKSYAFKPVKEGFVPTKFETVNCRHIASRVKAKAEAITENARSVKTQAIRTQNR